VYEDLNPFKKVSEEILFKTDIEGSYTISSLIRKPHLVVLSGF
jgi:hypothetical protein